MADRFKRLMHLRCGPGGINCPCCAYGKNKDRKQFYTQLARHQLKIELENEYHYDVDDADYFAEEFD